MWPDARAVRPYRDSCAHAIGARLSGRLLDQMAPGGHPARVLAAEFLRSCTRSLDYPSLTGSANDDRYGRHFEAEPFEGYRSMR